MSSCRKILKTKEIKGIPNSFVFPQTGNVWGPLLRRKEERSGWMLYAVRTCGATVGPQNKTRKRQLDGLRTARTCGPTVKFVPRRRKNVVATWAAPGAVDPRWARSGLAKNGEAERKLLEQQFRFKKAVCCDVNPCCHDFCWLA